MNLQDTAQLKATLLQTVDDLRQQIEAIPTAPPPQQWKPPSRRQFLLVYIDHYRQLKLQTHRCRIEAYHQTIEHFTGGVLSRVPELHRATGLVHAGSTEKAIRSAIDRTHKAARRLTDEVSV
mgnify:CR=1 FL=1